MFRSARIRHYLSVMVRRGFPAARVLEGSRIDESRLGEASYLVEPDGYRRVIDNVLKLSGDGGIAFDLGASSEITDLGIVGYAMTSAPTVREALQLWMRYSRSLVGMCWIVRLLEDGPESTSVEIVDVLPTSGGLAFCVEEFLAIMHKIGGALAGSPPQVRAVELPYEPPPHAGRYHEVCGCSVRFRAPRMRITLSSAWADTRLRTSDAEFNSICLLHCGQIMRQIASESPLLSRLRLLLLRSPREIPSLESAARSLGLSSRTLRRQLHDQGLGYQKLVDDFRTELAGEYLRSSTLTVKEIGYALGFASSSAFRRAFKSWTGQTVKEYRDAHR